jgi:hypothetical protein
VAAIEYSTLASYFVDKTSNATIDPILTSMPHHVHKLDKSGYHPDPAHPPQT